MERDSVESTEERSYVSLLEYISLIYDTLCARSMCVEIRNQSGNEYVHKTLKTIIDLLLCLDF